MGPDFTNRFNLYAVELNGGPVSGYTSTQALEALEEVAAEVLPAEEVERFLAEGLKFC